MQRYLFVFFSVILFTSPPTQGVVLVISQGQEMEISGSHVYERVVIQGDMILTGDTQIILTGPVDEAGRVFFLDSMGEIRQDHTYGQPGVDGTDGVDGGGGRDGYVIHIEDYNGECVSDCYDHSVCSNGLDAEDGKNGTNALQDAEDGEDGADGYTLTVIAHGKVDVRGDIILSGNDGGVGGKGGNGGKGGGGGLGMVGCRKNGRGGHGAQGGSGGDGAGGGQGGQGGVFRLTCYGDVWLGGEIFADGGDGGNGGNGGFGGAGGDGHSGGDGVMSLETPGGDGGNGGNAGPPGQGGDAGRGGRGGIIEIRASGNILSSTFTPQTRALQVIGGRGGNGGTGGGGSPGGWAGTGGFIDENEDGFYEYAIACGEPGLCSTGMNMSAHAGKGGDGGQVFLYAVGSIKKISGVAGMIWPNASGGDGGIGGGQFRQSTDGVCDWSDCDQCVGYTPDEGNDGLRGGDAGNGGYVIAEAGQYIRMQSIVEGGDGGRGGSGASCGTGWLPNPDDTRVNTRLTSYGQAGDGGMGGMGGNGGSVRYRAPTIAVSDLAGGTGVRLTGGSKGKGGAAGECGDQYDHYGQTGSSGLAGSDGKAELLGQAPEDFDATVIKAHILGQINLGSLPEVDIDTNHDGTLDVSDFVRSMSPPPKNESQQE